MKLKLPLKKTSFKNILTFEKQEKPGESDSMPQEGDSGHRINHSQLEISQDYWSCITTCRLLAMLKHSHPMLRTPAILHRIGTNQTVSSLTDKTHHHWGT